MVLLIREVSGGVTIGDFASAETWQRDLDGGVALKVYDDFLEFQDSHRRRRWVEARLHRNRILPELPVAVVAREERAGSNRRYHNPRFRVRNRRYPALRRRRNHRYRVVRLRRASNQERRASWVVAKLARMAMVECQLAGSTTAT